METYQARSNRRFFEIDPIQEENQELRQELEQLEQSTRERLAAVEAEVQQLRAVAEPVKARFFEHGHFSARVDLAIIQALSLTLLTLGVVHTCCLSVCFFTHPTHTLLPGTPARRLARQGAHPLPDLRAAVWHQAARPPQEGAWAVGRRQADDG